VQKALTSLLGNVRTNTTPAQGQPGATAQAGQSTPGQSNEEDSTEERMRRAMRRNWEMMQEMRRVQERAGGDGERGGGDRGGFDPRRFRGRGGEGDRGDRGDRGRDGR
jgi:hypothetical protein